MIKTTIIGEEIRKLRKDRGYKVEELANEIGISKGALGNIESGNRIPSYKVLKKLSIALCFEVDEFVDLVALRALKEVKEVGQIMAFNHNIEKDKQNFKEDREEIIKNNVLNAIELRALENKILLNEKEQYDIANLVNIIIKTRLLQINEVK